MKEYINILLNSEDRDTGNDDEDVDDEDEGDVDDLQSSSVCFHMLPALLPFAQSIKIFIGASLV